jgi:hypothetical protein
MPSNNTISSVIAEGAKIVDVWTANPTFTLGQVTLDVFKAQMAELQAAAATVESKRTELTGLMNARDAKSGNISELVSRARSGIRAAFGPDSTEYEQAGGTRRSERKPAKRKTNGTPQP